MKDLGLSKLISDSHVISSIAIFFLLDAQITVILYFGISQVDFLSFSHGPNNLGSSCIFLAFKDSQTHFVSSVSQKWYQPWFLLEENSISHLNLCTKGAFPFCTTGVPSFSSCSNTMTTPFLLLGSYGM